MEADDSNEATAMMDTFDSAGSGLGRMIRMLAGELDGEIRTDDMSRMIYSTDASMYRMVPLAVVIPKSIRDVQRTVEAASLCRVPILPRGGASSLAGQTVAEAVVIDVSTHLNKIIEINSDERWAYVEAGVLLDDLNDMLKPHGLMVGPDPASSNRATLGGMVANNSTGTHSIYYGNVIHHVQSVDVVLADGSSATLEPLEHGQRQEAASKPGMIGAIYAALDPLIRANEDVILRDTPGHWRRNSGYRLESQVAPPVHTLVPMARGGSVSMRADGQGVSRAANANVVGRAVEKNSIQTATQTATVPIATGVQVTGASMRALNLAHLMCGSEGTLGVITRVKIGLVDRPRHTGLAVVHFETRSQALRSVTAILETGPSAVELFDGVSLAQFRASPGLGERIDFVRGNPGGLLLTEYYGDSDDDIRSKLKELSQCVAKMPYGYAVVERTSAEDIATVWAVRKDALGLIMGTRGDAKPMPFIEDAAVPVEHLADYVERLDGFIQETNTRVVYYAHASGGCLHVRPLINTKRRDEIEKMRAISLESMRLVRSFGGSVSSEHGDGLARSWLNREILGPELYALNQAVKHLFDPSGLLNPGKIVDAPDIAENQRFGPNYKTRAIETQLDFSENDGFDAAVELCSGVGSCRKVDVGTMCPSFMVTLDEEHTTRGRANALRSAMSGALPPGAFTGQRMYDVMDLCIQCKACKTECPSNVDMAKIKTEWLSHYWQANGLPLRTRLFGLLPEISRRVAGPMAGVVNGINRSSIGKYMLSRVLGVSKDRTLPLFATKPFHVPDHIAVAGGDGAGADEMKARPAVVLFLDTFSRYHEPDVAQDAYDVLRWIGYDVIVPDEPVCCGRTRLSKGMVASARKTLEQTVSVLAPFARAGLPIVGLEPSCVSALTDDLTSVVPDCADAIAVSAKTTSIEQFLAVDQAGLVAGASWKPECRPVLLHGHCHQKSLEGIDPVQSLLRSTGAAVTVVDSGCCGMAGSFGYEKEHYDVSLKMAERKLAPAVRASPSSTTIAASGTSCRAQIADVTGRIAKHPITILKESLAGKAEDKRMGK